MKRLAIVLPASIAIIFGLLYASFRSWRQAFLILLNVPFALCRRHRDTLAARHEPESFRICRFIALFGVAVLNGIVMVSYINQLRDADLPLHEAVVEGASLRLRPVLMTALVASLGFVPMALSKAMGSRGAAAAGKCRHRRPDYFDAADALYSAGPVPLPV